MKRLLKQLLSRRSRASLRFDRLRLLARLKHQMGRRVQPAFNRLHFGCGQRRIAGWVNVDIVGSEYDVDLSAKLPWKDDVFDAIVSQQVIEHLDIESEISVLFSELARVCRMGGELWLACPDMEKVCQAYLRDGGRSLLDDRRTRFSVPWTDGMPYSQMINVLFHQGNEHKNLYDFPLLRWLLERHGFEQVQRVDEQALLARFPEFPRRNDDAFTLYVKACRTYREHGGDGFFEIEL